MNGTDNKNPLFAIATGLLASGKGGYDLIEEACDLVVADCRLNAWCSSAKAVEGKAQQLSERGWIVLLERTEQTYESAWRAWQLFQSAEWPRGRFEVWTRNSEALRIALRAARNEIDDIGRGHGRTNQRETIGLMPNNALERTREG